MYMYIYMNISLRVYMMNGVMVHDSTILRILKGLS